MLTWEKPNITCGYVIYTLWFRGATLACPFTFEQHSVSHFLYIPFTYKDVELQVLINDYLPASPTLLVQLYYSFFQLKVFD